MYGRTLVSMPQILQPNLRKYWNELINLSFRKLFNVILTLCCGTDPLLILSAGPIAFHYSVTSKTFYLQFPTDLHVIGRRMSIKCINVMYECI